MKFVRIGKVALDLDTCVFRQVRTEHSEKKGIAVDSPLANGSFTVWEDTNSQDYADLKEYVMYVPTLAQVNAERRLAQAKERAWGSFDPFLEQLPEDLFNIFRAIPGHEHMSLSLQSDGSGCLDLDGETVASWIAIDQGVEVLDEYRKRAIETRQIQETVEQQS